MYCAITCWEQPNNRKAVIKLTRISTARKARKNWIYSKLSRSNVIMALTKTLTRDKCVSKMSWANVILTLIPPLMHVKAGIWIWISGYGFQESGYGGIWICHYIWSTSKARSNMSITLTTVLRALKAFKGITALHTFELTDQRRSKAPWLCTTLILHHITKASQIWPYPASPL